MAERRMFSKRVIDSAKFLKMPVSARLLYYDLGMRADDDGIVEAFTIMKSTGAAEDDLRVLASKGYITILNEDLVSYITDWTENNRIRPDRKTDSIYKNLLIRISPDVKLIEPKPRADTGKITGAKSAAERTGRPMDDKWTAQDSIGKDRLVQDSIGKDRLVEESNSLHSLSSSCFEPSQDSQPDDAVFVEIPTNKSGEMFPVYGSYVSQMQDLYPAVNVQEEIKRAKAWCINNPKNRKTRSGMNRFLNSWLSRCQDRAKPNSGATPARKILARDYTGQYANDVWEES